MGAFPLRLGVHVSIAGGLEKAADRARELGCSAMQIFSRNPRGWEAPPLSSSSARVFREKVAKWDIHPVVVHTPYLLNLASGQGDLQRKSERVLVEDLERAELLGARFVVTHLGSCGPAGGSRGRRRVEKALNRALQRGGAVSLLLENGSGAGRTVGASLEEIAEIIEGAGRDRRLGVCFDSCHGFAAGYDFRSEEQGRALAERIHATVGWERLRLLHLNDSSGPLGAHRDRHEHIGRGRIGLGGFRSLLRPVALRKVPMILETPRKRPEEDRQNLSRIRRLLRALEAGEP